MQSFSPVLSYILVFRSFSFFCLSFACFFFSLPANVIQMSSRHVNISRDVKWSKLWVHKLTCITLVIWSKIQLYCPNYVVISFLSCCILQGAREDPLNFVTRPLFSSSVASPVWREGPKVSRSNYFEFLTKGSRNSKVWITKYIMYRLFYLYHIYEREREPLELQHTFLLCTSSNNITYTYLPEMTTANPV